MPERWRRELDRLGELEAPAGVVDQARGRPPGAQRGPSGRSRVVAAVVAFGVFAIAGGFALRAFDRAPPPSSGSPADDALPVMTVRFTAGGMFDDGVTRRVDTRIDYGDAHEENVTSTTPEGAVARWVDVDDLTRFVPGPTAGSGVTIESDGDDPRVLIGPPGAWPEFGRFERIDQLPMTPGDYVLIFEADYPEGTASTARRVQIVEPGVLQLVPTIAGDGPAVGGATAYLDGSGVKGRSTAITLEDLSPYAPPTISVPVNASIDVVGHVDAARAGLYAIDDNGWDTMRLPIDLLEGTPEVPRDEGLRQLAVDIDLRAVGGDWRDTARFFFLIIVFDPNSTLEPPAMSTPITVASPTEGSEVTSPVRVSGTVDLVGSSVTIRVMDAVNNPVGETTLGIDCVTGCRGDFSIEVPYAVGTPQPGEVWILAEDAADGSRTHSVRISVTLTPGAGDAIATSLEGEWTDENGVPVPDGLPGGEPLVLHTFEGAEHCGWTSITFLSLSWPLGTEDGVYRQYRRDPMDLFPDVAFDPAATLPADATATGYHRGDWELWMSDSDADGIYLVRDGTVERWPRTPRTACD